MLRNKQMKDMLNEIKTAPSSSRLIKESTKIISLKKLSTEDAICESDIEEELELDQSPMSAMSTCHSTQGVRIVVKEKYNLMNPELLRNNQSLSESKSHNGSIMMFSNTF